MSNSKQAAQQIKRNGSPSAAKQGPMKAVKVFSLKQISKPSPPSTPELSSRDSHKLWSRNSPDGKFSPERSPIASQLWSPSLSHKGKLRPSSADAILPSYLTGQWPKEINTCRHNQSAGAFVCDKSAQTVELESKTGRKKREHIRSASFGQGDQLQFLKQHLHKSKENKCADGKQQIIPIPGSHTNLTVPPTRCLQQTKTARHVPKYNVNRYQRNSVEGLNMEIEKLVSSIAATTLSVTGEDDADVFRYEIPDGHRAPGPELKCVINKRSVDTQTPSHLEYTLTSTLIPTNISASISPTTTPSPRSAENQLTTRCRSNSTDSRSSRGDTGLSPEPAVCLSSPQLKKNCPFVREPPDGCDRVTVAEESKRPKIKEPLHFSPVKPNKFIFKPSQGSAFCLLTKPYDIAPGSSLSAFSTTSDK